MARPPFADIVRDAYQRGKLILLDGPMGTELIQSGLDVQQSQAHLWNLSHPDSVDVVYEDYANAGAEALLTNTFSAHLGLLRGENNWVETVTKAIELARQPEWDHLYTLGAVGSATGSDAQAVPALMQVISHLTRCDAILVETQTRLDRVRQLVSTIQQIETLPPVMVSFSFSRLPKQERCWVIESTLDEPREAVDVANWARENADSLLALGVNCGNNLRLMDFINIVKDYRQQTNLPLLARPGITDSIECEFSPKEFAASVKTFADAGVTLLGGCCGTTPAYIVAARREIDRLGLGWNEVSE